MATLDNPFLEGRQYRSDELGDAVVTSAHWRWTTWLTIAGLMFTNSVWGIREMVRVPIKVMMLQIDESGTSRILGPLPDRYVATEQVIKKELRTFVEILRRVITDKVAMGEDWDERKGIYGRVTKNGRKLLAQAITEQGDPLQKREPVMIEVLRVLPKGMKTMDIQWIEHHYSAEMELLETTMWSGLFSYLDASPKSEAEFYVNPTGIWWDQWAFSKDR